MDDSKPQDDNTQDTTQADQPAAPVEPTPETPAKPEEPQAEAAPAAEPEQPAAEEPAPAAEPEQPAAEEPKEEPAPAAEPEQPAAEEPAPAAEPEQPAAEEPAPAAEPEQPAAEEPAPAAEPEQPAAEEPKEEPEPAAEPEKPAEAEAPAPAEEPAAPAESGEALSCHCPAKINAAEWDKQKKTIAKKFYKTYSPRIFFFPFSMAIDVSRAKVGAEKAGYKVPDGAMLVDKGGMFWSTIMLEIEGEGTPNGSVVDLNDEYYCKASAKPWSKMKEDMAELETELGHKPTELWMWYTACPGCIKNDPDKVKTVYLAK